ncbi:LabA-like NYN domain-containing protein [Sphaerospermopsis torques-reginae]|uniref:NYN domain-containing protein n=1 Tax=Sphaerospermopsis torques-reginae ITEP-024 TaxID=984208 RepID=A0ABX8WVS2_9CYAN|nr:NYN domain-containing protein [Sphaerospermopsis torques-reginae]QYX30525.1 NYN domain-containing protein [Sphaerospermopsis torques-reginae ITEP-024]
MEKAILGGLTVATTALMAAFQQPAWTLPIPMLFTYSLGRRQSQEKIHQDQLQVSPAIIQQWEQSHHRQVKNLEQGLMELQQGLEALQKRSSDWEVAVKNPTPKGRGRVAIFIDGSNLHYMRQELKIEIDYKKLLELLTGDGTLWKAFYYTGIDSTKSQEKSFISWLGHNGFQVVTKELVKRADGTRKANLDVEMAMDMRDLASHYDTAVFVGGDGDLACALEQVSRQGIRVEVLGLRSMTSEALIKVADVYTDLAQVKQQLRRQ